MGSAEVGWAGIDGDAGTHCGTVPRCAKSICDSQSREWRHGSRSRNSLSDSWRGAIVTSPPAEPIRVLIADDELPARQRLLDLLHKDGQVGPILQAENGAAA